MRSEGEKAFSIRQWKQRLCFRTMSASDCGISWSFRFLFSLRGIFCSSVSVTELEAGSSRSRQCQVHLMLMLLLESAEPHSTRRHRVQFSFALKTETKSQSSEVSSRAFCSFYKVGTEGIGEARSDPLFSLIVCTRGRTEELKRFLLSVRNQIGDISCEIILVDQNTDGRLDSIVGAYSDRIEIQHIRSPVGLSRGRNFGLRHVRGSVVAFPDDDCVYPENLLNDVNARLASLQTADGVSVMSRDFKGKASGPRWSPKEGWITKNNVFRQAISYGLFFASVSVRRLVLLTSLSALAQIRAGSQGRRPTMSCAHLNKACASFISRLSSVFMRRGNRDESDFRKKQVNLCSQVAADFCDCTASHGCSGTILRSTLSSSSIHPSPACAQAFEMAVRYWLSTLARFFFRANSVELIHFSAVSRGLKPGRA